MRELEELLRLQEVTNGKTKNSKNLLQNDIGTQYILSAKNCCLHKILYVLTLKSTKKKKKPMEKAQFIEFYSYRFYKFKKVQL